MHTGRTALEFEQLSGKLNHGLLSVLHRSVDAERPQQTIPDTRRLEQIMSIKDVLRKAPCLLPVAALVSGLHDQTMRTNGFPSFVSTCEASAQQRTPRHTADRLIPSPSWMQRSLSRLYLASLPLPRVIGPGEPAFNDAKLQQCIRQRQRDEEKLKALQLDVQEAQESRDPEKIRHMFVKITETAFGAGVTAQMREDFLARYGCTGWNDDILDSLVALAYTRGIVEIGAGHGQWARALTEKYAQVGEGRTKAFDFVLAYDDMTGLPLSTTVYHQRTQPANDFFFSRILPCTDVASVLRQWTCRGRVLMLVYPPPGNLALETIKSYVELGPENDTVVYVGEGRGGATANDALFDYLEGGDWALIDVKDVLSQPGGKGCEKLFIFKHLSVSSILD